MRGRVRHPGSALGEAIGKFIEADLAATVRQVAESFDHSVHPMTLRNHLGNKHQVDIVVSDREDNPVILIEPKYLRYKKHNWDKGSRLCIAHYSIPFNHIADVLEQYEVQFRWGEKDTQTPAQAWQRFCQLSEQERERIAAAITDPVRQAVRQSVETILRSDPNAPKRVEAVELSIRTSEGEHLVYSFDSVSEAIQRLLTFVQGAYLALKQDEMFWLWYTGPGEYGRPVLALRTPWAGVLGPG